MRYYNYVVMATTEQAWHPNILVITATTEVDK